LKKFVIVAVFLMLLAVWCVWLAATPVYREFWEDQEAAASERSGTTKVWVCSQKSGFSVFTHGKQIEFLGIIPQLDCAGPLSESVFDYLQEEIRDNAKKSILTIQDKKFWEEEYFVWDTDERRQFQWGLCAPEVLCVSETRYFMRGGFNRPAEGMIGRIFIWQDSSMVEVALADLFKSPSRGWFEVVAKEVEAELRSRHSYFPYDGHFPYQEFETFRITETGLKILIYGDTPVDDSVELDFSWDLMSPFLKPGAPVTIWYEKQLQKR
jgi:hypothetical protein